MMSSLFYQVENSDQPMQGNLIVVDSQFCAMDYCILNSLSVEPGFRIPIISRIQVVLGLYSRFQEKHFPDSGFPYMG